MIHRLSRIHRSHEVVLNIAAVVAFALVAPIAVIAQEQVPALAPVAGPSCDESSGYASLEASRAATARQAVPAAPSWDTTSGYASLEASRVATAMHRVPSGDSTWDVTSGYEALEISRVTAALPMAPTRMTSQVSVDVRWAPIRTLDHALTPLVAMALVWDETSGYGAVEASRAER